MLRSSHNSCKIKVKHNQQGPHPHNSIPPIYQIQNSKLNCLGRRTSWMLIFQGMILSTRPIKFWDHTQVEDGKMITAAISTILHSFPLSLYLKWAFLMVVVNKKLWKKWDQCRRWKRRKPHHNNCHLRGNTVNLNWRMIHLELIYLNKEKNKCEWKKIQNLHLQAFISQSLTMKTEKCRRFNRMKWVCWIRISNH